MRLVLMLSPLLFLLSYWTVLFNETDAVYMDCLSLFTFDIQKHYTHDYSEL